MGILLVNDICFSFVCNHLEEIMTKSQLYRKMKKVAKLADEMFSLSAEIEQELMALGYSDEELRDNSGVSLDELEMGNDIVDELMEKYVDNKGLTKC